jgi:hypothetical protein
VRLDCRLRCEGFDAARIPAGDPIISWHEQQWARMGFAGKGGQQSRLSAGDAHPQADSVAFFRGPLALSRDIRLGDEDIFAPLPAGFDREAPGELVAETVSKGARAVVRRIYAAGVAGKRLLRFCDFSSAGNTWDADSTFATWIRLR